MGTRSISIGVYVGGRHVETARFDRAIVYVGKLGTATLRIDDVNVSRKHAVLERRDGDAWWVTDLGSTNGTLLHRRAAGSEAPRTERVAQARLMDGDRLTLGSTTLLVQLTEDRVGVKPAKPLAEPVRAVSSTRTTAPAPAPAPAPPTGPLLEVAFFEGETFVAGRTFATPQEVVIGPSEAAHVRVPSDAFGASDRVLARAEAGTFVPELALPGVRGQVTRAHAAPEELATWLARGPAEPLAEPFRARLVRGPYTLLLSYGLPARAGFLQSASPARPEATHAVLFSVIAHAALILGITSLPQALLYEPRDPLGAREKTAQAVRVSTLAAKPKVTPPEPPPSSARAPRVHVQPAPAASAPMPERRLADLPPTNPLATPLAPRHPREPSPETALSGGDRVEAARKAARTTLVATELASPVMKALLEGRAPSGPIAWNLPDDGPSGAPVDPFGGTFAPGGPLGPTGPGTPFGPTGPTGPGGPIAADPIRGNPHRPTGPDLPWHEPSHDPVVHLEPIRQHGTGLAREVVENYIRRQLGAVKSCYQTRLQANPKLQGRLVLSFVVLPSGAVGQPAVSESTLGDAELHACITAKLARWQFPRPDDDSVVEVTYPVLLKTQ